MENISKFSQGTIWQWLPEGEIQYSEGVQAGPRPVLIISNNTFNAHSSSVNCLTITSVLKESPVHVSIHLSVVSHIQCEQVHTIPKKELEEFKGIVSHETMNEIKEKLKFQFNMSESKNLDIPRAIESKPQITAQSETRDASQETAILKEILSSIIDMKKEFTALLNHQIAFEEHQKIIQNPVESINNESVAIESSTNETTVQKSTNQETYMPTVRKSKRGRKPLTAKKDKAKEKAGRRSYNDEDKAFILDESNSLETLMEKYGYRDRETAYKVRYYFKRTNTKGQSPNEEESDDVEVNLE